MEYVPVGTDHDLDCIYEADEGFSYLTTICRAPTCTHVVQVIEEGLGPLPRLEWVDDVRSRTPVSGIGQPWVAAVYARDVAQERRRPAAPAHTAPVSLHSVWLLAHLLSIAQVQGIQAPIYVTSWEDTAGSRTTSLRWNGRLRYPLGQDIKH